MIAKLAGAGTLGAFRGRPAADVEAAVDVIRRVGQLALDLEDRIAEVEINPLMVTPAGAIAVDAIVQLGGPEMAPRLPSEGGYAPLALPRPQRSSRPGQAGALLDNAREPAQGADS